MIPSFSWKEWILNFITFPSNCSFLLVFAIAQQNQIKPINQPNKKIKPKQKKTHNQKTKQNQTHPVFQKFQGTQREN